MELLRALAVLVEPPSAALERVAAAVDLGPPPPETVHTDLFGFQLYPFASVYLSADGMLGGEARDRIAGFWRAIGAQAPEEPDHVATMLGALASLLDVPAEGSGEPAIEARAHAGRAFFDEHVRSWLPAWITALDRLCAADPRRVFYRRWGRLVATVLAELGERWPASDRSPIHLRDLPRLADPEQADTAALLGSLLAPAVSGIILARDDLARCARDLHLGLRHGERRFVLRALLGQRAEQVFAWLAAEADRQAAALAGDASARWSARAGETARWLRTLAEQAAGSRAAVAGA